MKFLCASFVKNAMVSAVLAVAAVIPSQSFAASQSWNYTYDDRGLKISEDGPRTDVDDSTHYTYDAAGNLVTVTQPLGYVTTYHARDEAGRVLSVSDAGGLTTEFEYQDRGWLAQSTVKDRKGDTSKDRVTRYEYYADGQLKQITAPNGAQLRFEYNSANHLTAIANPAGERIEYELDAAGNRTKEQIKSADGSIVYSLSQAYDELSRLMTVLGNNGQATQIDYDANANPTHTTNALSATFEQQYDALDRLKTHIDPLAAQTHYQYDAQGNLSAVTDANGNTTYYTYDGLGNLLSLDSPDTGLTTYAYDEAGNRIRQRDARGVVTEYRYDALNRLTQVSYPASPTENVTYTYCPPEERCFPHHLRRITTQGGNFIQIHTYNDFYDLELIFRSHDGAYASVGYTYDAGGDVALEQQFNGLAVSYQRDDQGRVVAITASVDGAAAQTVVKDVTYLPFGAEKSYTYGNGLNHALAYSLDYQIERIQVGGIDPILDYAYAYSAADTIVGVDDGLETQRSQVFDYDDVSRLIHARGIYGEIDYQYDPVGNRLKLTRQQAGEPSEEFYGYYSGTNQLNYRIRTLVSGGYEFAEVFEYDAAGNLSERREAHPSSGSWTWVIRDAPRYNHANRRVETVREGQTIAHYHYNPLGQRIAKVIDDVVTERYFYGASGQLLQVADGQNNRLRQYFYLNGKLVGMLNLAQSATALYYVHHDHLGTPHKLTNTDQQVVWSADYQPFGEAVVSGEQEVYSRFPGQYYDEESGLYYNYFRDYDPSLGRYVQSDPIGLDGGINTYAYVAGNPLNYIDPTGESPVTVGGVALVGLGVCVKNSACRKALVQAAKNAARGLAECFDEEDGGCDPPEGTMCYEHKPPTLNSKTHAGYEETWRVFQMQKIRGGPENGQCKWKYLGGKLYKGVWPSQPPNMQSCSTYPNFTGRQPKGNR